MDLSNEAVAYLFWAAMALYAVVYVGHKVWRKRTTRHWGWLYFIGGSRGAIKVGITKGLPMDRLRALQTGNPTKLHLLHAEQVTDPAEAEGIAHTALTDYHVGGEWYEREATLAFIRQLTDEEDGEYYEDDEQPQLRVIEGGKE